MEGKKKLDNDRPWQSVQEQLSGIGQDSRCIRQYPRRKKNIETRMIQDGQVILRNLINSHSITLAPIAAITWEFCDGINTVDDIVEAVGRLIGNPLELDGKIRQLLNELVEAGFLSLEPDPLKK